MQDLQRVTQKGQATNFGVAPDKDAERTYLPAPDSLRGKLILFDRGYTCYEYCSTVKAAGGDFIGRVKDKSFNPHHPEVLPRLPQQENTRSEATEGSGPAKEQRRSSDRGQGHAREGSSASPGALLRRPQRRPHLPSHVSFAARVSSGNCGVPLPSPLAS